MSPSIRRVCGSAVAVFGLGTVLITAPTASAIPPNCTAADLANVSAGVSAASAAYLFTHPDVNAYLTSLRDDTDEQASAEVQQYLEANPQIKDELRAIRQPLEDLKMRCGRSSADSTPSPSLSTSANCGHS